MHARIDALTCPHFWSLLPSRVFDWVVVAVSIRDAMMPLDTPLHPMSITSITLRHLHRTVLLSVGAHEHCSRHSRSTSLEAYSCWGGMLSLLCSTHHIYSHLSYTNTVGSRHITTKQKKQLEKMQKYCIHTIAKKTQKSPYRPNFQVTKIMKIEEIQHFELSKLLVCVKEKLVPTPNCKNVPLTRRKIPQL